MKLSLPAMLVLFVLGAVAALVGDHGHVATGTTEYLTHSVPYIWSSPIWFPAMVGVATVSLAELRLHLPHPRPTGRAVTACQDHTRPSGRVRSSTQEPAGTREELLLQPHRAPAA
jgi:hypothetical protein